MSHLYPIKFAFGSSIPIDIQLDKIRYYQEYFSKFLGTEYTLNSDLVSKFKAIPVDENSAQFSAIVIFEFLNILSKTYNVVQDSKFKCDSDLVVIDLRENIKLLTLLHMANEIALILNNEDSLNKNTRFALIIDSIAESDKVLRPIEKYIKSKKVFVIDVKRKCLFGE